MILCVKAKLSYKLLTFSAIYNHIKTSFFSALYGQLDSISLEINSTLKLLLISPRKAGNEKLDKDLLKINLL
jgi:hypothetical protein